MISLCPLTVLPCSPLDQIDAAAAVGYDAIGLRLTQALATDIDVLADQALLAEIADRLESLKISVLDVEVVRITPTIDVSALRDMLAFSGRIGALSLAVTGLPKSDVSVALDDEYESGMVAKLRELCEVAAEYDVRPSLEFMIYRTVDTLQTALRLIDKVGHDNLSVCIDALHFHRSRGSLTDLAQVDPRLISCFQICDAPAVEPDSLPHEARFGRMLPGTGGIPLVDILGALPAGVPIGVEAPTGKSDGTVIDRAQAAAEATRAVLELTGRAWA